MKRLLLTLLLLLVPSVASATWDDLITESTATFKRRYASIGGDNVNDSSGNAQHGTANGSLTYAAPDYTGNRKFVGNATDASISIPSYSRTAGQEITIAMRVRIGATAGRICGVSGANIPRINKLTNTSFSLQGSSSATFTTADVGTADSFSLVFTIDSSNNARCYVNGTESTSGAQAFALTMTTTLLLQSNTTFTNGEMEDFRIYSRVWSAAEVSVYAAGPGGTPTIAITNIVEHQIFQQEGGTADIAISGTYADSTEPILAKWGAAGTPQTIVATPAGGTFTGTLTAQAMDFKKTLYVYFEDASAEATVAHVGVGDIFVIAGQSNASGRADNNQLSTGIDVDHEPSNFDNNAAWVLAADPVDADGTDYTILTDATATGNWAIPFADLWAERYQCAVGIAIAARGGQPIANFDPSNPRYDAIVLKINDLGGKARAILWWQGESDALADTETATFVTATETTANALATEFPNIPFIGAKIHNTGDDMGKVWAGWDQLVSSATVDYRPGPDFSPYTTTPDANHWTTDVHITFVAEKWMAAVPGALGESVPVFIYNQRLHSQVDRPRKYQLIKFDPDWVLSP